MCEALSFRITGKRESPVTPDLNFILLGSLAFSGQQRDGHSPIQRVPTPTPQGWHIPGQGDVPGPCAPCVPEAGRVCVTRELRPGNMRASTGSSGPQKPPQNCSLPSALLRRTACLRQLQEALLTREHCDSCLIPPLSQRGPFRAADLGGRGPLGMLVSQLWAQWPWAALLYLEPPSSGQTFYLISNRELS